MNMQENRLHDSPGLCLSVWLALLLSTGCSIRNLAINGYKPAALETGDILPGLQTGLIDAVPVPPLIALAGQINGPAPHMLDLNCVPIVGAALIRSDLWEKIPPKTRRSFQEAAAFSGEKIRARGRLEDRESVKSMQKRGLTVHATSPVVQSEWSKLALELHPLIRGKLVPGDMFDEVQRLLRARRAANQAAGK
ncbi:MAG: TRAP transporter substrate-binding protein DctP [Chloroflexi bacterium]|nr:TRAP transporter substrate-binding protein DctP [Chloroflexota bacterium]